MLGIANSVSPGTVEVKVSIKAMDLHREVETRSSARVAPPLSRFTVILNYLAFCAMHEGIAVDDVS